MEYLLISQSFYFYNTGFDAARKKFTELELTLQQLAQSQSIPVVRLEPDERIVELVAQKGLV